MRFITLLLIALAPTTALAEQRSYYDASGRSVGKSSTDSQGTTTFYDSRGNVTGRASTDTQGTTTIYDPTGRDVGRTTSPATRTK
jgi:YD repeat-containing protein